LASAPIEADANRDFLQRRLTMFASYCFWIAAITWGLNAVLNALFFAEFSAGRLLGARSLVHCGTALLWGAAWLALRYQSWPQLLLAWAELVLTEAMALGLAAMVLLGEARLRSDMVMVMAVGHVLVLRAAVLPSTGARTAGIGAAAHAPIVVAAYVLHQHQVQRFGMPAPASIAAALVVWTLISITTTTMISATIYGLSQRVRAAARLGQYTIERQIGAGGMGVVYRAKHALLRRPTAVKLLSSPDATETQVARFEREVQFTAALSHPNIVSIYDYGRSAAGIFYYAMEYVDGIDLERLVEIDGPQLDGRVRDILLQVADGLAEAHATGLVHRDIKPSNILLTRNARGLEQVKIVDFGLVKDVNSGQTQASGLFTVKGTPLYMAPEAITGKSAVDARTDLYSLGAVAFYLLTGKTVFTAGSIVEICAQHLYSAAPSPSARLGKAMSKQLEHIVLRCLSKSPAERPESAAALRDLLLSCDDCEAFTLERSQQWWSERRAALHPSDPRASGGSPSVLQRLRVDPMGRS
jgi:serine/threonine-protein kinase